MVNTRVSLHMCVLLSIDVIASLGLMMKGYSRKLSSGDEETPWRSIDKFQKEKRNKQIQEGEHLGHVDFNLSSAHQGVLKNVIFFSGNHFLLEGEDPRQI